MRQKGVPMITVHHLNNSRSQRILWTLEELGVPDLSGNAQRLFQAGREPKELWLAPGSGHAMARLDHGREYVERVHAFFQRWLVPKD